MAGTRYAHTIIATPMMIVGSDSHCPIENSIANSPRKLSGSRAELRDKTKPAVAHQERD